MAAAFEAVPLAQIAQVAALAQIVFVVDDDDDVRLALQRLLGAAGHAVKAFADAAAFLAHGLPPLAACLIMDMEMPHMSGMEALEALTLRGLTIPVIFLSGHGSIPMTVRAMKAGALEFLSKPVPPR